MLQSKMLFLVCFLVCRHMSPSPSRNNKNFGMNMPNNNIQNSPNGIFVARGGGGVKIFRFPLVSIIKYLSLCLTNSFIFNENVHKFLHYFKQNKFD